MGRLSGKVAIVTGAAGGQGEAEARLFAAEGAMVVVTDIQAAGQAVADSIGDAAIFIIHDVSSEAAWTDVVARTLAHFGRIDILVNNAALYDPKPLLEVETGSFERHLAINLTGPMLGMRAVAVPMQTGGGGSIINVSSISGMRRFPGQVAYAATKWGLRGLSGCAAGELGRLGIRVNSIMPGMIRTAMLDKHDPADNERFEQHIPLGRIGESHEIAKVALFLASDEASYLTGSEIVADAGISL